MKNFKQRWGISSNWQLLIILVVFAITGSSAAYLSEPVLGVFGIIKGDVSNWIYFPLYILLIFPIYQILLVTIGTVLGQNQFFWAFEKKMLQRLKLGKFANFLESKFSK